MAKKAPCATVYKNVMNSNFDDPNNQCLVHLWEVVNLFLFFILCLIFSITAYFFNRIWFSNKRLVLGRWEQKIKTSVVVFSTLSFLAILCYFSPRPPGAAILDGLAILGVAITVASWREAVDQNTQIKEIQNSLPTRYIDKFPNFLSEVCNLITSSKSSFYILADCADYGSFSDPERHLKVIEAIQKVQENHKSGKHKFGVTIQIAGPIQAISRSSQFWDKWIDSKDSIEKWGDLLLRDEQFSNQLKIYCETNKDTIGAFNRETCDRDQFEKMMLKQHTHFQNQLRVTPLVRANIRHMPGVFFWMKDETEAVFLLSHTGSGTQGIAFYTRDFKLIDIMLKTWNGLKEQEDTTLETIRLFKEIKNPSPKDFEKCLTNYQIPLFDHFLERNPSNPQTKPGR
jgi:hypothetical protein